MIECEQWGTLQTGLDEGYRVCAIGDVHGCADQLNRLLDQFASSADRYAHTTVVFLGDLIDRGAESLKSIDLAMKASARFNDVVYLMGNHEQLLCKAISGEKRAWNLWLRNGGGKLLAELQCSHAEAHSWESAVSFMREALGEERTEFLKAMHSHARIGNLFFVHAGTNPKKTIEEHFSQKWDDGGPEHWAWIRDDFLEKPFHIARSYAVHGHTPVSSTGQNSDIKLHLVNDGKINLDAGSFNSGCVAGAEFIHDCYRPLLARI